MADTGRDPAAIRAGIDRAREQIEQSVNDLRTNVSETLNWRSAVRRNPAAAFGGAVLVGMLIAKVTTR
jgi:hypothetical protein